MQTANTAQHSQHRHLDASMVQGLDKLLEDVVTLARVDYLRGPASDQAAFTTAALFLDALGVRDRLDQVFGVQLATVPTQQMLF